MTSPEILRRLMRRFGLLLLLTAIGATAGAVYSALRTPTYTAKAYVVAIGDPGESITALNFAQAYGRIATSGPVVAKAGALLGSAKEGLKRVTASTSPDAPVIEITATGPAPERTAYVANAVATALTEYGSARQFDTHVTLSVLAAATTPARPSSPKPPAELAVGAAAGLLIGGLAALAGVGRRPAPEVPDRADAEPEDTGPVPRYEAELAEAEEIDEPVRPAEIERYMGGWRAKHPPRAITSYRSRAAALSPNDDSDDDLMPMLSVDRRPVDSRPVGRRPVESRPVDRRPVDRRPVERRPVELHPAELRPEGSVVPGRRIVGRAVVAGTEDE
jgi:capsular polysaccharide biosynthesis protein